MTDERSDRIMSSSELERIRKLLQRRTQQIRIIASQYEDLRDMIAGDEISHADLMRRVNEIHDLIQSSTL
jgi:transcriptional regulator with AAA-type ATPase domain